MLRIDALLARYQRDMRVSSVSLIENVLHLALSKYIFLCQIN